MWIEGFKFVYCSSKEKVWDCRKGKLQLAEIGKFRTAEMPTREGNGYNRGIEAFWND